MEVAAFRVDFGWTTPVLAPPTKLSPRLQALADWLLTGIADRAITYLMDEGKADARRRESRPV